MAEPEEEENQFWANKAEAHPDLNPKEDGQLETQTNAGLEKMLQQVLSRSAKGKKQGHGDWEHGEGFKKPDRTSQKSKLEDVLEKSKIRPNNNTNTNEGDVAGNQVNEEAAIDPIACRVIQGEKNDSTEERNIKEDGVTDGSVKEDHHVVERNQAEGEVNNRECLNKPCGESVQRGEEEDQKDVGMKQTEKIHEPDMKTSVPEDNGEITGGRSQEEEEGRKNILPEKAIDRPTDDQHKLKEKIKKRPFKMKTPQKKAYYVLKTGNTLDSHHEFLKRLHKNFRKLKEVNKEENSDFILVFCPVVSRAGTDIEAALRQLNTISGTKHAVLVVLHCTNDQERFVGESKRAVARDNTQTVDCLFHENIGLYKCSKNDTALKTATAWIKKKPWKNKK